MLAVLVVEVAQIALLVAVAAGILGWRPAANTSILLVAVGLVLGTAAFAVSNLADVSVDQLLRAAAEGAERLDPPAPRGADQLADKLMILEERVDQPESRLAPQ